MIITIRKYRYTEAEHHNRPIEPGIWTPYGPPDLKKTYPSTTHKMDYKLNRENEFGGLQTFTELDTHSLHDQSRNRKRSDSGG